MTIEVQDDLSGDSVDEAEQEEEMQALLRCLRDPDMLRNAVLEFGDFPFEDWSTKLLDSGVDSFMKHEFGAALLAVVQFAHRTCFEPGTGRLVAAVTDRAGPEWSIFRRFPIVEHSEWVPFVDDDGEPMIRSVVLLHEVDISAPVAILEVLITRITAVDGSMKLRYFVARVE